MRGKVYCGGLGVKFVLLINQQWLADDASRLSGTAPISNEWLVGAINGSQRISIGTQREVTGAQPGLALTGQLRDLHDLA
ncbi:hypothetical protein [Stenotrophomonas sp.]|uniref:hypothetical protein n=1 Tax=Stenotrophomonas sp. TaxID=69392 RepID=UPI00289BB128|nr:hypothetical protein [Stenotrophomonas sp.]